MSSWRVRGSPAAPPGSGRRTTTRCSRALVPARRGACRARFPRPAAQPGSLPGRCPWPGTVLPVPDVFLPGWRRDDARHQSGGAGACRPRASVTGASDGPVRGTRAVPRPPGPGSRSAADTASGSGVFASAGSGIVAPAGTAGRRPRLGRPGPGPRPRQREGSGGRTRSPADWVDHLTGLPGRARSLPSTKF